MNTSNTRLPQLINKTPIIIGINHFKTCNCFCSFVNLNIYPSHCVYIYISVDGIVML